MGRISVQVLHTGEVCVSPYLPFGGENCSLMKASGFTTKKEDRLWLPVSVYLIEHPQGRILFDTGWERAMSPEGAFDKDAQIASLGSSMLYRTNQGVVPPGQTAREQLHAQGIEPEDLDYVILSHSDCDHANGLPDLHGAKSYLVSAEELACAQGKGFVIKTRFQSKWWEGVDFQTFDWNGTDGPAGRSYDLFGDGSIELVNIPGHTDGLVAMKITGDDGRYVLLSADGAYAAKSWEEMILPGISMDKVAQKASLQWIREQSMDGRCIESIANHDRDVEPHAIVL